MSDYLERVHLFYVQVLLLVQIVHFGTKMVQSGAFGTVSAFGAKRCIWYETDMSTESHISAHTQAHALCHPASGIQPRCGLGVFRGTSIHLIGPAVKRMASSEQVDTGGTNGEPDRYGLAGTIT